VTCCSGRWPNATYECAHCGQLIRHDGDREWVHHGGLREGLMTCFDAADAKDRFYAHPDEQECRLCNGGRQRCTTTAT